MHKLLFGTAGIPLSCNGNTSDGVKHVRVLGLDAMELEFVHSVNISEKTAPLVKKAADDNSVVLTCHAPYYINLNAQDSAKMKASIQRLITAARVAWSCSAWGVAFHPGFYMKKSKEETYKIIKENIRTVVETLKQEGNDIWIRPEITGKRSQFGDFEEIVRLSQELEHVLPCIDYGHMHAREGKFNRTEEFRLVLEKIEKTLGKESLDNMHIQIAGIEYTEAGERRHINLEDSDLNFLDLIESWKDFNIKGVVISESPNIEGDALMLKRLYKNVE